MRLYAKAQTDTGEPRWHFWCPGCDDVHGITSAWTVVEHDDGTLTVDPSILVTRPGDDGYRCHSYLRAGVWEYLTDCTHPLAGQRVPMVEWPYGDD